MSGCLRGRNRERIEGELHERLVYGRFAVVRGKAGAEVAAVVAGRDEAPGGAAKPHNRSGALAATDRVGRPAARSE